MKLGILIVSKDRPDLVDALVGWIGRNVSIPHDVHVVESGTEPARFSRPSTLWFAESDQRGSCFGHNLALQAALLEDDYDHLWVLRSDQRFEEGVDAAACLVETLEQNPRMAVLSPAHGEGAARPGDTDTSRGWHPVACCEYPGFLIRAEAVHEVGFLNPDFVGSIGAGEELAYRLFHNDWSVAESDVVRCTTVPDSPFTVQEESSRARRFAGEYFRAHFGESWDEEFWDSAQGHGIEHNPFAALKLAWAGVGDGNSPWPLATNAPIRLLAWPRYDRPTELDALLELYGRPILGRRDVCLCLRHDACSDGSQTAAVAALEEAYTRVLGLTAELEVLLVDDPLTEEDLPRLGRAVAAVIPLPSSHEPERASWLGALGCPVLGESTGLQEVVPGALAVENGHHYSREELDSVDWDLVEVIKALHPWMYPIHLGNLKVEPGRGTGLDPEQIERVTAARAASLVFGVRERVEFQERTVLDLGCNCAFWSARYAELGAVQVTGVEPSERFRRQAELYWSRNRFLPEAQVRFLDGDLGHASTWDEISSAGPHDVTLCVDFPDGISDGVEFLRRACEVTREVLILDLDLRNLPGALGDREQLAATLSELGFECESLTGVDGAAGTHVTLLVRRAGVPAGDDRTAPTAEDPVADPVPALPAPGRQRSGLAGPAQRVG